MPELTPKERLQPSLLDRLTDDAPSERVESRDSRVLSPARLRDCVLRDLGWLLNTTNLAFDELDASSAAGQSVINYGLPDIAGKTLSSLKGGELEKMLLRAIQDFEPRLVRDSVRVRLVPLPDGDTGRGGLAFNSLAFIVEAELWAQPMPLALHVRTEVDLDNGDIRLIELVETPRGLAPKG